MFGKGTNGCRVVYEASVRWTCIWKAEMAAGSQRAASFPYKKVPS